jgi:hypothetical protein
MTDIQQWAIVNRLTKVNRHTTYKTQIITDNTQTTEGQQQTTDRQYKATVNNITTGSRKTRVDNS